MSGLRAGETEQPPSEETQPAGEDDWLSNLQNLQAAPESGEAEEPIPASSEGAPDLSAWLGNLNASDDVTQRAQPEAQWGDLDQTQPAAGRTSSDLQSWLQNLDAGETTQKPPAVPQPEAEPSAQPSFGITGWLNSLETPGTPAQPAETPAAPATGETPSWMAGLEETTPAPAEVQPSGEVELPTWMMEATSDQPPKNSRLPPSLPPPHAASRANRGVALMDGRVHPRRTARSPTGCSGE